MAERGRKPPDFNTKQILRLELTSMLSSVICSKKQLESCGRLVPALNSVGEACVNHRSDIRLYVCRWKIKNDQPKGVED